MTMAAVTVTVAIFSAAASAVAVTKGQADLLSTDGFQLNKHWELKGGVLSSSKTPRGILWSRERYEDFQVTLDYRTSKDCNSGLFFRTDSGNAVQGGFEIQIASDGKYNGKHVVGSLYDAQASTKQVGKPDGEWNTMVLTCRGPAIKVVLNGEQVLEADIDTWVSPKKNPDGSPNKFKTALKDLPRIGHIGLQYHGQPVSFRNIIVKPFISTQKRSVSRLITNLEAGKKQTVVAYGTSLTKVGAWSDQLRAVLEQNYQGQVTLINSAQGGSNSAWGRKSFDEKVIKNAPDTVFIEFAINDAVDSRNVSIKNARENLEDMIDRLLKAHPACEVILMTMNPAIAHHGARRPRLTAYYQMYRDVAKDRKFQLIDHYPAWNKLLNKDPGLFLSYMPDGIHPVREGTLRVIMPTMIKSLGLKKGKPELNERSPCWNYLFGAMDKEVERNKQVSNEEYNRYWKAHFNKHDANKDGMLQSDEYTPAVMFKHIDADNDGIIKLKEYQAAYAPFFKQHDANADAVLDRSEIWKVK